MAMDRGHNLILRCVDSISMLLALPAMYYYFALRFWLYIPVHHSIFVDIIITASVLIASIVTWIAYRERRSTDTQMAKLMQDMAALQSAEESLIKLQRQYVLQMFFIPEGKI